MTETSLDVLVVDDSAVVRQLLSALLAEHGDMRVAAASDPLIAMRKMRERRPDVIVLDVEMPRMDGLTFLRRLMAEDPVPVVICSSHAGRGSRTAIEALAEGAVDVVAKPQLGVRDFLHESALGIVDTVRAASRAHLHPRPAARDRTRSPGVKTPPPTPPAPRQAVQGLVAIGVSTGGPAALDTILTALEPYCLPLAIVQHMPEGFTAALAQRLDRICRIAVREASGGELLTPGLALIAPGGRHLEVRRTKHGLVTRVSDGPPVSRHRPSVDVLFRSVARVAGADAAGVILTGMGDDGAAGLAEMKRAGAMTLAQDEASSVVFGMPKSAIERGCVDEVRPLAHIARAIQGLVTEGGTAARILSRSS